MSTGDISNNISKLSKQIKTIRYDRLVNWNEIKNGSPDEFLPILHHVFIRYSPLLADHLVSKSYVLYSLSDAKFIETIYKLCREWWSYIPVINTTQFFLKGYAERKIIFTCRVIELAQEEIINLKRRKKKVSPLSVRKKVSNPDGNGVAVAKRSTTPLSANSTSEWQSRSNTNCTARTEETLKCKDILYTPQKSNELEWKSPSTIGDPLSPINEESNNVIAKNVARNLSKEWMENSKSITTTSKVSEPNPLMERCDCTTSSFDAEVIKDVFPELIYSDTSLREDHEDNEKAVDDMKLPLNTPYLASPVLQTQIKANSISLLHKIYDQQLELTKVLNSMSHRLEKMEKRLNNICISEDVDR